MHAWMDEETWMNPDGGLTVAQKIVFYASRWRHYWCMVLMLTRVSVSGLEPGKGWREREVCRLVRNAITDHPTLLGSFINTRGSPSRSGAIISQSQQPPSTPTPRLLPPSLPPFTPQSNMINPTPSYLCPLSLSPSLPLLLTANMAVRA